jgi:hypothetical protein
MFTATKGKALLTTTTGALPRPGWYTANLRGMPLSYGLSQAAYREQHFDCLACNVIAQHRAGIDILVDGDARLDNDVAGRSWVSYATERIAGIGKPRVEVPPAHFMADKGPGDLMWEVIETRMTPPVEGPIGATTLELDRAYKAIATMTDRPVKIGSIFTGRTEVPISSAFLVRFATRDTGFANPMFTVHSRHRVPRHAFLVRRPRVPGNLVEAGVTRDGGDLVRGTSGLGEPPTRGLAQAVR